MRYFLAANARAAHRLIDIATHSIRLIHKFRIIFSGDWALFRKCERLPRGRASRRAACFALKSAGQSCARVCATRVHQKLRIVSMGPLAPERGICANLSCV
jgi:hypothetical protein